MMRLPPIPSNIDRNITAYLHTLSRHVQMELGYRSVDDVARNSIILLSPDGSAWEIKVDNTGVLSSTKVQG